MSDPCPTIIVAGFTLSQWPDEHKALRFPAAEAVDIAERINADDDTDAPERLNVAAWGHLNADAYTVDNGAWFVMAVPADYVPTPKPGIRHVRVI